MAPLVVPFRMLFVHQYMSTIVLLAGVVAPAPAKENEHHNHTAIIELQGRVKSLEDDLNRQGADLAKIQGTVGNLDKNDFVQMQQKIDRHETYFGLLTAFTGVIAAAVVGEFIKRLVSKDRMAR